MGADRKGPLAAFIVIAIIAAVLLVTSVRSQAATVWLGRALPSAPELVDQVGAGLDQVVEQGSVLVHKTDGLVSPSRTDDASPPVAHPPATASPSRDQATTRPAQPSTQSSIRPTTQPTTQATTHPTGQPVTDAVRPGHRHGAAHDADRPGSHGRHLGWTHADHDHGHPDHGHADHGRHLGHHHG